VAPINKLRQSLLLLAVAALLARYKPLAGVTGDMVVWLFQNDHKNVTVKGADNNTRNVPM
jgi:hypothetical protein